MSLNAWSHFSPTVKAKLNEQHANAEYLNELIAQWPGTKKKGAFWLIPRNCIDLFLQEAQKAQVPVISANWEIKPGTKLKWEEIHAILTQKGELRSFILADFLMPYQIEALEFGWHQTGVNFWHPTGSGKTLTGFICSLNSSGPLLIVTRAASRIQYAREIERFSHLRSFIIQPASHIRKKDQTRAEYEAECREQNRRPVYVIGWENLQDNLEWLEKLRLGCVIFDEAHRGKNSKRWEVVPLADLSEDPDEALAQAERDQQEATSKKGFIKDTEDGRRMFVPHGSMATAAATLARHCQKRIGTTATPVKDRVRDLYGQLDLVEPNAWGSSSIWLARYADAKKGIYGGIDTRGASNLDELRARLKYNTHILDYRVTHQDLPAKRRQSIYIPPDQQLKPPANLTKELQRAHRSNKNKSIILEIELAITAAMKRKAVTDIIENHIESKHKITIFTARREDCDKLGADLCKNAAVKEASAKIWAAHGEVSTKERQQILDEYMSHPGPCVLVATGASFGESLNIQDTDAALFVMLPPDPGQLRQWEGRFCRNGQKRPVIIYYVIAEGTVDEHAAHILINKLPAVEKIAEDSELAEASFVLAGRTEQDAESFAASVLSFIDEE